MKKTILFFLSLFCCYNTFELQAQNRSNSPQANEIDWCETYTESVKKARKENKPLLILFTGTNWCPACMKLEREVLNKPQFAQALGNKFVFYKAEFPSPTPEGLNSSPDKVLLDRYNVDKFPTFVAIDGFGALLFTMNYASGGPDVYIRTLNDKLQSSSRNQMNQSGYFEVNPQQSNMQQRQNYQYR